MSDLWPLRLMLMVVTTLDHMQAQIPADHWPLNEEKEVEDKSEWLQMALKQVT